MALPGTEDTGFCSSEDYLENDIHSPTDSSEDSVEVKVSPISFISKRKRTETRKVTDTFSGPLKKRMCLKVKAESNESHPFRPWSPSPSKSIVTNFKNDDAFPVPSSTPMCQPKRETQCTSYFRPPSPIKFLQQTEPVALVKKCEKNEPKEVKTETDIDCRNLRVPLHPQVQSLSTTETERIILKTNEIFPSLQTSINCGASTSFGGSKKSDCQRREQRNYKNMTRERRIEANARERTRVHTISAAFDTLRKSIPSYSHNQKLSKLSVLRIACSYIMTLSSIVNSETNSTPSTSECVDMVSSTIQREGKLRKKKDDND
ncbi:uncharacterized protein LOC108914745 [Anoplophora glabripennis]|uniref:uncharacterized protein LOC108914745 n=1 Tax=Anoplophora glabripennis TaxID=217634 RepID=UPI000874DFD7|nr:uncharacterized protein LOC108914745 [Anoplophora glabripennis]